MIHSMQTIANTGSLPMVKKPLPKAGSDAVLAASVLAASVAAFVQGTLSRSWQGFGVEVINLPVDGREAFLTNMQEWLKDIKHDELRAIGADPKTATDDDKKKARKRVASATVQVSMLNTIVHAFNGLGTIDGLILHYASDRKVPVESVGLSDVGFAHMYEYARAIKNGVASKGGKTFAEKLAAWLKNNTPDDTAVEDGKVFTAVVDAFNATQE